MQQGIVLDTQKQWGEDMSYVKCTNVDYIIHSFTHSDIDLEEAIDRCKNSDEVTELAQKLGMYEIITAEEWEDTMEHMDKNGKLDRFIEE